MSRDLVGSAVFASLANRKLLLTTNFPRPSPSRLFVWAPCSNMSSVAKQTPAEARLYFRRNAFHGRSTSGWCLGSLQANVAILPSSLADDFERFCEVNKAPCPLLYRSERGELAAGPLADNSDIRTDVTKYCIFEHGMVVQECPDLLKYPWHDMVSFYIGCSFSFEEALVGAGICEQIIKRDCGVPMYITNIHCHSVGPFACPMVVSMRPIPKDLVEQAIRVTSAYDAVHGAPIHIGDPAIIGISDINTPDYGPDACEIGDGDVPVFWACGVTSSLAVRSAKPLRSFGHSPGFMFICDMSVNEYFTAHPPEHGGAVSRLLQVTEKPFNASVLSDAAMRKVGLLESTMQQDLGGRGIRPLCIPDELVKAAARLSQATSVAITTGFPCQLLSNEEPEDETDGLPGVIAVAKALQTLGKNVSIIACEYQRSLLQHLMTYCCDAGVLSAPVAVVTYKAGTTEAQTTREFLFPCGIEEKPAFDMMVAIEAGSRNAEGKYMTMRAIEVPILEEYLVDGLFIEAYKSGGTIGTVGIGDGGNEIGMGKVRQQVLQHVPNGEKIASCVSTDHLVAAGVSNWGGYALAAALYVLHKCLVHSRFVTRGLTGRHQRLELNQFVNNVEQEREMLAFLVSRGLHDGITGLREMSVDNLPFDPDHANMLNKIRQIATAADG